MTSGLLFITQSRFENGNAKLVKQYFKMWASYNRTQGKISSKDFGL